MNVIAYSFKSKRIWIVVFAVLVTLFNTTANAQVPPRFYWKTLQGTNAIPIIAMSTSGNTNPLDPSYHFDPSASLSADVAIAGFAKIMPFGKKAGMLALLVPMGRIEGEVNVGAFTGREVSSGFGDPMVEFNMNLIGPPPIMNLPDLLRYEPGFSLDMIVDVAIPIGQHDKAQSLNLGQNRWYGRVGFPMIWQIGPWIPDRRTTFELFPSVWFFQDNSEYVSGYIETDPTIEIEAHLTRNFTSRIWGSVDATYIKTGDNTIDGITISGSDMPTAGFTLGYQLNDSMQLTFGYKSTFGNDSTSSDIQLSTFSISFVAGWHPLIEGVNRLTSGG